MSGLRREEIGVLGKINAAECPENLHQFYVRFVSRQLMTASVRLLA